MRGIKLFPNVFIADVFIGSCPLQIRIHVVRQLVLDAPDKLCTKLHNELDFRLFTAPLCILIDNRI